ncbi:malonyl-ACP O-methyltransferase BioC [Porphyromonas crevioricanis]|uniref:Malonyl-[acyl-carrier protein] O-methyltransferase n=1 Tax=Porphyromonas crevioricanis TaxID=393921 RepID=A0AB34PIX4_9PORP|nr:malonyl-ACP O-methyltransferase BioC [Porphyromonas crevioricanis]KGN96897.1 hypothetical protein HQ38_01075 [Porphyromonas crevioricanis]
MESADSRLFIAERFRRALPTYEKYAVAQQKISNRLISLAEKYLPTETELEQVLEIGCGSGMLTRALLNHYSVYRYTLNDLYPEAFEYLQSNSGGVSFEFICGDAEQLSFEKSHYDLVISASTIQWFKDLSSFFSQIASAIKPGGYLLLSTFAPDNLCELNSLIGQKLHYHNCNELSRMLTSHYEVLEVLQEEIVLHFANPMEVLKHLKYTGVTATESATPNYWTPKSLKQFIQDYKTRYSETANSKKVRLTYKPIYIVAREPL